MFNTIDEVYDYWYNKRKKEKRENLNRIKTCFNLLNLKANYKIIHIAGTNGKGSTALAIKNILANKYHVGFIISPFILKFNERIQINDRMISDSEIMHYANILYNLNENYKKEYDDVIPFFELTLLMALMYFNDRNIDYLVLECGLGGRLDATNFLDSDIEIITNIGYDHMAQLGNTLEEISYHKLGITRENHYCLTTIDEKLYDYFNNYAKENNIKLKILNDDIKDIRIDNYTHFKYKNIEYKTNLLGLYQAKNMSLAIECVKLLDNSINDDIINFSISNLFWPGRFEIIQNKPLIILDGAHNISAINELIKSINLIKDNRKIKIIFTALMDKDYKSIIKSLDTISNYYYFTTIDDLRKTDSKIFKELTNIKSESIDNYKECIDKAINELQSDEILLITGSLHFISEARKYIKK